jgi:hypothetical protein
MKTHIFKQLSVVRSFYKLLGLLLVITLTGNLSVYGQNAGDYRTRTGGNWSNIGTWQVYNGSNWVNASDYPGQNPGAGTVTISNNHNVTLNVSPVNSIGQLVIAAGNSNTNLTFNVGMTLTVTGNVTIYAPTQNNRSKNINVNAGVLNCSNVILSNTASNTRDVYITLTAGTLNVSGDISMAGNNMRNYILFNGAGTVNVGGTITGGGLTSTSGGGNNPPTNGTVNYNSTGDQNIGAYTYYNLSVTGGGTKSLTNNTTVNNTLTVSNSILSLGNYNLVLPNSTTSDVQGGPFSASCMIATDGTGYIEQAVPSATPYTMPIGSNGVYSPVVVSSITGSSFLRFRTVYSATLGSKYLKRYWQLTGSGASTATISFQYDATENPVDPTLIWVRPTAGAWAAPSGTQTFDSGAKTFTVTNTTDITNVTSEWTAGFPVRTFFSYQSGNWDDASTWTNDPGGTTWTNIGTPSSDGDIVVILSGRTVSLSSDVTTTNLEVNINQGGILDMGSYQFTNPLGKLAGQGILKLSTTNFPTAATNTFVDAGGGITEYYNPSDFTLPIGQTTYNTLRINAPGVTATQLNNLTLNGDLHVMQGTYRINDNTSARRELTIMGSVTVENGASITVGNGVTNTTTDPTAVAEGGTAPLTNYYYTQSHTVQVYGDFTNYGTVRFTNLTYPVYNQLPPTTLGATSGYATVFFRGTTNSTLWCEGTTDFYNLVLDKGVDQTYSLTVYSTAYQNFRLFGANIAGGYGGGANPNLDKALWIRTGTLVLQGTTIIPSLSEGTCDSGTGGPNSDYFIPGNGALVLNGDNVVVLTTADSYQEVNVAYNVSAPNDASMGINTSAGCSSFSIYGLLKINKGYISTRESGGFIQWPVASGQFEINGGTVDAKQYRTAGAAGGLASFTQTGGTFYLRGRFTRTPLAYTSVNDLINAPINTNRSTGGLQGAVGTFNLNEADNVFNMSGGSIYIYDVCGDGTSAAQQKVFEVYSDQSNIEVSGGSIIIMPTTGTGAADSPTYRIVSTAPFGNLSINRQSGTSNVMLDTYPLTVISNFSILSGDFDANSLNVTIGGNFFVAAGTTYTTGDNWTIFNGIANQTITSNTATPLVFKKLKMDKLAGKILNFSGSQTDFHVQDSLMLVSGTFNDGGKTISLIPSTTSTTSYIYNSATHLGSGKIVIADDDPTVIDGDGNGVFNNLELNNTDALDAPVSLSNNISIAGALTFSQDKLLDINAYNIKFSSTASIVGTGSTRYITSSGEAGNGGVTRSFTSGATSFTFPVGTASTSHAAPAYTPATVTITGTPTSWGDITVVPVGYEHPATTNKGRSLTYYWRVKTTSLTLGSATASLGFTYDDADVVTGGGISENEYVAARFNIDAATWTSGTASDVDETTNLIGEPGTGSFLENLSSIDGDYTAGDNNPTNPFGTPTVYYSRQSGNWNNVNTWSTVSHTGPAASSTPGASDIVIIGDSHTVTLTQPENAAILKIAANGVLDIVNYTSSTFSMVLSHPSGNGLFRLKTTDATWWDRIQLFSFPNGDFSDFNVNKGTTEFYTTTSNGANVYILPPNVTSYGNLILSPNGLDNLSLPNNSLTTIYGDLTINSTTYYSWTTMSWNTTRWGTNDFNPTIEKTVHVKGSVYVNGGSFVFMDDYAPQHLVIDNDLVITPGNGANIFVLDPSVFGTWIGGTPQANTITISGSIIHNGDYYSAGYSGLRLNGNTYYCDVTFNGSGVSYITNTDFAATPYTRFRNLTVNKGTSQADSLVINIDGDLYTPTDNWLTLQNGTLVYRRTDPNSDFTISTTTPFIIPETAGLLIDYPNNANNTSVLIANANTNSNDVTLAGKFAVRAGQVYVGPTNGTTNSNNDIVYTGDGNSTLVIDGGQLFVNGQIRRNTATTTGVLKYYQTDGEVYINGQGADATSLTRAKLEVTNNGSVFNMSGGVINIVRGGGTTFGDLYLRPQSSSVTGGEIVFSPIPSSWSAVNANQTYRMDANIPLNNITITGDNVGTPYTATVSLMVNPLELNSSLTLSNNQSFLVTNDIDVSLKGDWINNGTYTSGSNTTTFNGNTQLISGASLTAFNNLVVNPITSVTLTSNDIDVNGDLTLSRGTLICDNYQVNVKGDFTNNATYTDNGNNTGVILNGSALQYVSGNGTFSTLELYNASGARLQNSITLNKNLVLTQGIFNINQYMLNLTVNSIVDGAPFGSSKMVMVDGAFSNVGIRKYFDAYSGAAQTFTYPLGVMGKYTPAVFTYTDNTTTGYIRINAINSHHPGVLDPNRVLQYYWEVENNAVAGLNGTLEFYYDNADVKGSEVDYVSARTVNNTSWSKTAPGPTTDNVDETNDIITFILLNSNDITGEFTAGEDPAIPNNIPQFTSQKDGNWNDPTVWVQTGGDPYVLTGGPNGFIVTVSEQDTVDLNENQAFCYRMTIDGTLRVIEPYYGHNIGTVLGQGTLYLDRGPFPAGRYDSFVDCSTGGTIEYGGNTDYNIAADLYSQVRRLHFTGTGIRYLPNKDLTICEQLLINGPTVDNTLNNKKLTILGTMERYGTGAFKAGTGANATVELAGSAAQSIGGPTGDFSGSNKFNNLVINNTAGVTIGNGGLVEVGGNLYLTNGVVTTSATNQLYISNSAISCVFPAGGSSASYVDGPLTKKILQGDSFKFPIGKGTTLGNKLTLTSSQAGTIDWTAEFFTPNPTYNSYAAPLTYVNSMEYWTVNAASGSQAYVALDWDAASDLTPLMTQNGLSDMRVAYDNAGVWTELSSTASGTSTAGTVTTSSRITIPASGSQTYTTSCINTTKPRARFNPSGPVCGDAGIPVIFIGSVKPLNYVLEYTKDGVPQTPVTVTSVPYTLPTDPTGATYQLTSFTYNNPGSPTTGVVDPTPVTTYTPPTTAAAGPDQSLCGATQATLAANTPTVGTGLWSIVSGLGGTVQQPTNPSSLFDGINGNNYTLRWTITNGGCTSSDDVNISFPLLPETPAAFVSSDDNVCQGDVGVAYSVANNPSLTYTWSYSGTGTTINGSGNAITIDYGTSATSGDVSVYTTNGCGNSAPLTLSVTVNQRPSASIAITGSNPICDGDQSELTITLSGGTAPYDFQLSDGTNTYSFNNVTSPYVYTTSNLVWTGPGASNTITYSIPTVTSANGCSSSGSNTVDVNVYKIPETGPEYHIPNNFAF